ncbi:hypothetical protein BDV26DRAFT_253943 [Aspergillus bertholletiae]|uniref:Uncharacterized protein n=1 Tax=Aspergillus bertholletiae TaxID=1226010 RepID=A0A5N7BK52_9EURO|nr:hypothetical protein BDV26DRAFT_253943 [Aspergillus bertholletiae]
MNQARITQSEINPIASRHGSCHPLHPNPSQPHHRPNITPHRYNPFPPPATNYHTSYWAHLSNATNPPDIMCLIDVIRVPWMPVGSIPPGTRGLGSQPRLAR